MLRIRLRLIAEERYSAALQELLQRAHRVPHWRALLRLQANACLATSLDRPQQARCSRRWSIVSHAVPQGCLCMCSRHKHTGAHLLSPPPSHACWGESAPATCAAGVPAAASSLCDALTSSLSRSVAGSNLTSCRLSGQRCTAPGCSRSFPLHTSCLGGHGDLSCAQGPAWQQEVYTARFVQEYRPGLQGIAAVPQTQSTLQASSGSAQHAVLDGLLVTD
jgi:hypothetical protein